MTLIVARRSDTKSREYQRPRERLIGYCRRMRRRNGGLGPFDM